MIQLLQKSLVNRGYKFEFELVELEAILINMFNKPILISFYSTRRAL